MKAAKPDVSFLNLLPPVDLNQRYTIEQTAAYLKISKPTLYVKIKRGDLEVLREGSRVYIPGTEIARASSVAA